MGGDGSLAVRQRQRVAPGVPRVLVLTTHPVDELDGADKLLARALIDRLDARFTWFGRLGTRASRHGSTPPATPDHASPPHATPEHAPAHATPDHAAPPHTTPGHAAPRHAPPARRIPIVSLAGMPGRLEQLQIGAVVTAIEPRHDLVHAIFSIGSATGTYARLRERLPATLRRPLLHTVPGIADGIVPGPPLGVTVALSRRSADRLHAAGHRDVRVVPPGIDVDRWPRTPLPDTDLPTVLFAGHSDPTGGAREAILVVGRLQEAGVRCRLRLAIRVRPGQRADVEAARLVSFARRHGVDEVGVLGPLRDFPSVLRDAHALLFPATSLGAKADVPLTLVEGMATGRPVVTTDFPELDQLGDAVDRVPAGDIPAAATALATVLTDEVARAERVDAGRGTVEERFTLPRMVAAYADLYAELLAP